MNPVPRCSNVIATPHRCRLPWSQLSRALFACACSKRLGTRWLWPSKICWKLKSLKSDYSSHVHVYRKHKPKIDIVGICWIIPRLGHLKCRQTFLSVGKSMYDLRYAEIYYATLCWRVICSLTHGMHKLELNYPGHAVPSGLWVRATHFHSGTPLAQLSKVFQHLLFNIFFMWWNVNMPLPHPIPSNMLLQDVINVASTVSCTWLQHVLST